MKHLLTFITAFSLFINQQFNREQVKGVHFEKNPPKHQSTCELNIHWQSDPLFKVTNFLPGDISEPKDVTVSNSVDFPKQIGLKGWITGVPNNPAFLDHLILSIKNGNSILWTGKLSDFFQSSNFVSLDTLPENQTKTYTFSVSFDPQAGNLFQNDQLVFSISIACMVEIPPECQSIANQPNVHYLFGTNKKDTLTSGSFPSIIFGFGGNDILNGNNDQDCLIGGDGDDKLHGNNKNDILLGGNGKDDLFGGNGTDLCKGGETIKTCETIL